MAHQIKKGLELPITGAPGQTIEAGPTVRSVAVLGRDYVGMKPTMRVKQGDKVQQGQELFADKKNPGVVYTAPASGTVAAINRGEKRVLQSVVIDVEGDDAITWSAYSPSDLGSIGNEKIRQQLVESGSWTAFRTRPFSKVPAIDSQPHSIFVNAMETRPLAADPALIIAEDTESFKQGLELIAQLTEGKVFVCAAEGASIPTAGKAQLETFNGPHPAGLPGTHIHTLDAVSLEKSVWTINYQEVIAIGKLFTTGKLNCERVVALAGPQVEKPRLIRTHLGASTDEMTAGQLKAGENRVISGSVLSGECAYGPYAYLGRYDLQVSVIREGRERNVLEYLSPGSNKHSVLNIFLSKLNPGKRFDFTSTSNGSARAMVPVGAYEKVMPLDILPTQLLRSIIVGDSEMAQKLGVLELDEEDLALCTYVCPGKYEYGPILRDLLTRIETEG